MKHSWKKWIRVRRELLCPICKRFDWCLVAADGSAAICARVESDQPAGRNGAGWLHRLTDDDWKPSTWRRTRKPDKPTTAANLDDLHQRCRSSLRPESRRWLATALGISIASLESFQVGYHPDREVYSFPMRRPDGSVCGLRYRTYGGKKFSETGGRDGLFFGSSSLIRDHLVIVEGPTDAMAMADIGVRSVIGRSNCWGNVQQIVTICRRLHPRLAIIVPDNDVPGFDGVESLRSALRLIVQTRVVLLPDGIKDVRDCIQEKENADWLAGRIGEELKPNQQNGELDHERDN